MKNTEVHPLRQERLRRGWTQKELADFAQVSLSSVERAERGEPLRVDICKRLCECLNKKRPEELSLQSYGAFGERQDTESDEMKRRQVLQLGAMGASLLTTHQLLLHSDTFEQISMLVRKPSHVDVKTIQSFGTITEHHWQLVYGGIPKRDLLAGVQGHLQSVTHFLQSSLTTSLEQKLCEIASQQAQIMSEIYFDMHDYPKAETYSTFAIEIAQRANNPALYAVALARMSFLETYRHRFKEALALLHVARRYAEQAVDSIDSMAGCWIAAIEAEVQANIFARYNDIKASDACLKALDRAECITEQAESDPYWTKFGAASLAAYKGVSFRHLRKPVQAQIVLHQALNTISKDFQGSCGTVLTDLAGAYAQQGEIEEACNRATQALHIISEQNKSVNVFQRVCDFRLELESWASTSYVEDLDEHIAITRIHIM